jgi:TatD DNase family protein
MSVTTTSSAWGGTIKVAGDCNSIKTAIGLHPQLAHERYKELSLLQSILPQTRFVGEIGLDGGPTFKKYYDKQLDVLRKILETVRCGDPKVFSIHSRYATGAVIDEIKGINGIPILHWFTGTKTELKKALDIGCYFSFGPVQLSTKKGIELGQLVPKDRLLTETDGPFTNNNQGPVYPWDIPACYHTIAKLWNCNVLEVEAQIEKNLSSVLNQVDAR